MSDLSETNQSNSGTAGQKHSVSAGERGVAIDGNVSDSTINTGDVNVYLQLNVTSETQASSLGLDRAAQLEELERASTARCIERWQAAGLRREESVALAEDQAVGRYDSILLPTTERPVLLLIGELGVGKSLIAERLLQEAIARARDNTNAPIPVYLKARDCAGHLHESLERSTSGLGNCHVLGVAVIVDGADEVGAGPATRLLSESRILAGTWPNTTVVLTSRPLLTFAQAEESFQIPLLTERETYALIDRIVQQPIAERISFRLPASVRDAVRRPLFAILLAVYLREHDNLLPRSTSELLASLVEGALSQSEADLASANQLLQRLAIRSLDRNGGPVPASEVASRTEQQTLLDSRLVVERSGTLVFPLPILTEWFAANSLADGIPTPTELLQPPQWLEKWRYSLILFAGLFGHEQVTRVLSPLAEQHPALISEVISRGLESWGSSDDTTLPLWQECGQRVRETMQSWVTGIGPLAHLIAPVGDDGTLLPLGARTSGSTLTAAWYRGSDVLNPVVELPPAMAGVVVQEPSDWYFRQRARPTHESAWAWRWTLNKLVSQLSELLRRRALPIPNGPLDHAEIWQSALALTGRGALYPLPILLSELEERLSQLPAHDSIVVQATRGRHYQIAVIRATIARLREAGETELQNPWPGPDRVLRSGWIWESYSPEQMLVRAIAMYEAALDGYRQTVNEWFPNLAPKLRIAATMPARLVGIITPSLPDPGRGTSENRPRLQWYFEPLPEGSQTAVDFRLGDETFSGEIVNTIYEQLQRLRPDLAEWIGAELMSTVLDVFAPDSAIELMYTWLWKDLHRVSWVEGTLGAPR